MICNPDRQVTVQIEERPAVGEPYWTNVAAIHWFGSWRTPDVWPLIHPPIGTVWTADLDKLAELNKKILETYNEFDAGMNTLFTLMQTLEVSFGTKTRAVFWAGKPTGQQTEL